VTAAIAWRQGLRALAPLAAAGASLLLVPFTLALAGEQVEAFSLPAAIAWVPRLASPAGLAARSRGRAGVVAAGPVASPYRALIPGECRP
jgi:hypothetical protein